MLMSIDVLNDPKSSAYKKYTVKFTGGMEVTLDAMDREDAQELAIQELERMHIVHDSIVSIRKVS